MDGPGRNGRKESGEVGGNFLAIGARADRLPEQGVLWFPTAATGGNDVLTV